MPNIVKVTVVEVDVHILIASPDIYVVQDDDETIFIGG